MNAAAACGRDTLAAELWQRRYEREHQVRLEAESIGERGVRELYDQQRQLRLLQAVATAANRSLALRDVLGFALREAAQYLNWPLAHALTIEAGAEGKCLVSARQWHGGMVPHFASFRQACERERFPVPVGLPGRVLAAAQPAWIRDVTADGNFPRATPARNAGLRSAMAFPVLAEGEVVAVLELFDTRISAAKPGLLDLMAQVGQQLGWVAERQRHQDRLQHDALHDPLTGLPNRTLMLDRVTRAGVRLQRHPGMHFSVLCIDLDRFKVINDSLGHAAGDRLLQEVAERLKAALRNSDAISRRTLDTLAHVGGDEFMVLLEDLQEAKDAARVAERLRQNLERPFTAGGQEVYLEASMGIASSARGVDPEQMLRDADVAMHRAKGRGGAGYAIFDEQMHAEARSRLALETELRKALQAGQFELHYQPIVRLGKEVRWCGVEALVRWRRQDGRLVYPGEFIGVAEEMGLIGPLGLWVLREACAALRRWRQCPAGQELSVSVNLSPRQMAQPDLVERVGEIVRASGLPPHAVHLEITESVMLDNAERALQVMGKLKALGVKLSLDDFGTGYSSLSYLHRYPFDTIKIDRSFVVAEGQEAIVRAIVQLAGSLDMEVIAEGAESAAAIAGLQRLGCKLAQGYYFSRPLPAGELEKLLAQPVLAAS